MRRRIPLIWLGATAVVSGIVGLFSFGAGWAAGLATRAVPFFGPLPFLLLLLLLVLVFRRGRRWGPRHGAHHRFPGPPAPGADEDPWKDWPQRPQEKEAAR